MMSSRAKQDALNFPVRKTRSSRFKKVERKDSPIKISHSSPVKLHRKENYDGTLSSPRKTKLETNNNEDGMCSPPKKSCPSKQKDEMYNRNVASSILNTPLKTLSQNCADSPRRCLGTPPKNLNNCSPRKSLVSRCNLESPIRKSPRKLELINSPSSLISRLSVSSPKGMGTTIGLHAPELKPYHSLKTAFSHSCHNDIVGRNVEVKFFEDFLHTHLTNKTPASLYVSGAPGTGKTATVTKVVNELKGISFKKVFLNCMASKTPKEIFSCISQSLKLSAKSTEREIVKHIEKVLVSSKVPIVFILDEVDQLESKNQEVLYTLFEWPSLSNSKLILIGIANMLDLTDRILPRLQANHSCRPKLLHFPPYNKTEIVEIINGRIKEADIGDIQIIKPSAVHFLAGKVSAVAGDIRKALDVCRRAVELCEMDSKKQLRLVTLRSPSKSPRKNPNGALFQVDMPKILRIFNEVYGSRVTTEITNNPSTFPLQQKVLLCSLLLILKHSKNKTVTLGKFHEVYIRVCQRQKLPGVEQSEFFCLCTLLESRGMLQVKRSKELRNSKVLLRLDEEEAANALGDKALLVGILEDKESLNKASHKRT